MSVAVVVVTFVAPTKAYSQHWLLGGNVGLSLLDGSAGFHMTPMAELLFNRNMSVGSELSINTQYGAPVLWYPYFKYYFDIRGSKLRPYANAGPVLTLNVPNAPCFGILFGGGINIPVASKLYLAPDVLFGPVFGVGGGTYPFILQGYYWGIHTFGLSSYEINGVTIFTFSIRGGLRYEI